MGLFSRFRNKQTETAVMKMVTEVGNGYYAWDGKLYHSDIIRACMRPKVKAIGKLTAQHIRKTVDKDGKKSTVINPEPYIRFLLEDPNPLMSMQKLLEKVTAQLILNSNAFILILRDDNGLPINLYPVPCSSVQAIYDNAGRLYLRFTFLNGNTYTFAYTDLIHLREDFYDNDIFGTPKLPTLASLMEIVNTTDQGIVTAVKNSGILRWLLKYKNVLKDEDLQKKAQEFAKSYLSIENSANMSVAAVDARLDTEQVAPHDYVPNSSILEKTYRRVYSALNTNENIVQSKWTEDDWNSYYEAEIEPVVIDLTSEFTRKLFTRHQRAYGNTIMFTAANLQYASLQTKLSFVQMVDRKALNTNEWRDMFNLPPTEDGDQFLRRLDTAVVSDGETDEGGEQT